MAAVQLNNLEEVDLKHAILLWQILWNFSLSQRIDIQVFLPSEKN